MNIKYIIKTRIEEILADAIDEGRVESAVDHALSRIDWETALNNALTDKIETAVEEALDDALVDAIEGVI